MMMVSFSSGKVQSTLLYASRAVIIMTGMSVIVGIVTGAMLYGSTQRTIMVMMRHQQSRKQQECCHTHERYVYLFLHDNS